MFTKAALAFGALYGYAPIKQQEKYDILKFWGIMSPIAFVKIVSDMEESKLSKHAFKYRYVGTAVIAPLYTGLTLFIGYEIGKMARKSLNDN